MTSSSWTSQCLALLVDEDWPAIYSNLSKVHQPWVMFSRVLTLFQCCTRNCLYFPVYCAGNVDASTISTTMSFSYSNSFESPPPHPQTPLFLIPLNPDRMRFASAALALVLTRSGCKEKKQKACPKHDSPSLNIFELYNSFIPCIQFPSNPNPLSPPALMTKKSGSDGLWNPCYSRSSSHGRCCSADNTVFGMTSSTQTLLARLTPSHLPFSYPPCLPINQSLHTCISSLTHSYQIISVPSGRP
jgi:hypothetical protein